MQSRSTYYSYRDAGVFRFIGGEVTYRSYRDAGVFRFVGGEVTPLFSTIISLLMPVFKLLIISTLLTNLKNLYFNLILLYILLTRI